MRFSTELLSVGYELEFDRPKIRLADFANQTLECFYNIINPYYPLKLSDLQWIPSTVASNFIQVTLFSGNGILQVLPEKFTGSFTNLKTKEDIEIIEQCIRLCEQVLAQAFPETEFGKTVVKTSSWLNIEEGETAVETILQKGSSGLGITIDKFNATGFKHSLRAIINNQNEKWDVDFLLEKSAINTYDLFFVLNGTYLRDSKYDNLDKRASHIADMYPKLLSHFGLEPAQQPDK
ncbi:MAG: hypothetical protein ACE5G9_02150 [Nitrospinales bacterium]